ncbi:MAG: response regulator [Pseudomonadota bacterium]
MLEPRTGAGPAANIGWAATGLGDHALWPHTLRVAIDIMFGTPCPMLLLWGERRIAVVNPAYAELAGPQHTALVPAPLAAAPDAFARAASGEHLQLAQQMLALHAGDGQAQAPYDLQLTPLHDQHGQVAGVLCAVTRSQERPLLASAEPLRVLVVEDNLDSQYLVCEMLKAFGHDATGIGHAEGALALLARDPYDVLFSDVSLPGMSGVELARHALRSQPGLRVIFASGYGDALLRQVEFPFRSLQKPYELEQLQAALAAIDAAPSV